MPGVLVSVRRAAARSRHVPRLGGGFSVSPLRRPRTNERGTKKEAVPPSPRRHQAGPQTHSQSHSAAETQASRHAIARSHAAPESRLGFHAQTDPQENRHPETHAAHDPTSNTQADFAADTRRTRIHTGAHPRIKTRAATAAPGPRIRRLHSHAGRGEGRKVEANRR